MTTSPRVTVAVTTHNRAEALAATMASLLKQQTCSDFELLICDDASSDATPEVAASFDDCRVRYLRHESNIGAYANWKSAVEASHGEYIAVYHDHDVYSSSIVERSMHLLDENPGMGFVHTGVYVMDLQDRVVDKTVMPFPEVMRARDFLNMHLKSGSNHVVSSTAMARRLYYDKAGGLNTNFLYVADWDIWCRVAAVSESVGYIAEPLLGMRAREPGHSLGGFSWRATVESVEVRECAIRSLTNSRSLSGVALHARFAFQRDQLFLMQLANCSAKQRWTEVEEGGRLAQKYCSPTGRLGARLIGLRRLSPVFSAFMPMYRAIRKISAGGT